MDTDLFLTIGVVLTALSLPSLLQAWTEGRPPRVGGIMIIAGIALIVTAVVRHPQGYAFDDIPHVMLAVAARLAN